MSLFFVFNCCDKNLDLPILNHNPFRKAKVGKHEKNLKAGSKGRGNQGGMLLTDLILGYMQFAPLHTQDCLPRDGSANSKLGTSTSISNQEIPHSLTEDFPN